MKKSSPKPAKKWPTVESCVGDKGASREELTRLPALSFDLQRGSAIEWDKASRVCSMLSENSRGVLIVELPGGVVVIKASSESAQTVFATKVLAELGIRTPQLRVVEKADAEWASMRNHVSAVIARDQYLHGKIKQYLSRPQVLVMQTVTPSTPVLAASLASPPAVITDAGLRALGGVLAADLLLNNPDRMPLGDLWGNVGNPGNVLLPLQTASDPLPTGVDPTCIAPSDPALRARYLSRVEAVLSSEAALTEALGATVAFLESNSGMDLGDNALARLREGFRLTLCAVAALAPSKLLQLREETRAVPRDGGGADSEWAISLRAVDVDFLAEVVARCRDSPLNMRTQRQRIAGAHGLAEELQALRLAEEDADTVLVFDFDRTLTNGFSNSGDAPLPQRVRGGQPTVDALRRAKEDGGARLVVVTAREPRAAVVNQMAASFRGPQREIGGLFLSAAALASAGNVPCEEAKLGEVPLAFAAHEMLYAADYQKPAAVAHALMRLFPEHERSGSTAVRRRVHFVDDMVFNAHDVASRVPAELLRAGRPDLVDSTALRVYWWDTFDEETGPAASMAPVHSSSDEYGYPEFVRAQLDAFGIDGAEMARRNGLYRAMEKASGRDKPPTPKKAPGKLKGASDAQEKLAGFLFGGGKARAMPPDDK